MSDPFRPRVEPARTIYDALIAEAGKRAGRTPEVWIEAEKQAVLKAAQAYAAQRGFAAPTLAEISMAEAVACGHTDYGAQWAYGVARLLERAQWSR